jgi:transcriptional regulator with XRE-family HTH domain
MDSSAAASLLRTFLFRDARLGEHPRVRATVYWEDFGKLALAEQAPSPDTKRSLVFDLEPSGPALEAARNGSYYLRKRSRSHDYLTIHTVPDYVRSVLAVPILDGSRGLGVLTFDSSEESYLSERDVGRAQFLAGLLAYTRVHPKQVGPITESLGRALASARQEMGISQEELARRLGHQSRTALSRWENGAQFPSLGLLSRWCSALGLVAEKSGVVVQVTEVTDQLLSRLRLDPRILHEISPGDFERFVAGRLDAMGFDVMLTGSTNARDGGIDMLAVPKLRTVGSFLLAGQVKHHSTGRKTGRDAVDRMLSWRGSAFALGLVVTNTSFSKDAIWTASQGGNRAFLRLRDFSDLTRWIQNEFDSEMDWREIPDRISLAPGVEVEIPKVRVRDSLSIWPVRRQGDDLELEE